MSIIFSIATGVQHDGRVPFWKLASVFDYVCTGPVFAFGEINILLLLLSPVTDVMIVLHYEFYTENERVKVEPLHHSRTLCKVLTIS